MDSRHTPGSQAAEATLPGCGFSKHLERYALIRQQKFGSGGVFILDELARLGSARPVVRKIIQLAANWNSFHLANNEYDARGVVQKARELTGVLAERDAQEKAEHERAASERADRQRQGKEKTLRDQSALLLAQFDAASAGGDPQHRGYLLQDLLNRVFDLHGLPASRAFQPNQVRNRSMAHSKWMAGAISLNVVGAQSLQIFANLMDSMDRCPDRGGKRWDCFFRSMAGRTTSCP